jgi:hypothetical protein
MNAHKNVFGHTNCYTVKLNRHTDKVLMKTFFKKFISVPQINCEKVLDPAPNPAPDPDQAPDPD